MTTSVESEILNVLRTVAGSAREPMPLHAPEFTQAEQALVMDCIDSSFVSSVGKYVDQFEAMLAKFTGPRRVVAVVNGTAALEVALSVAGVRAGDEVIVPALSFVAHCVAIPHIVGNDANTLGLDPLAFEDYLDIFGEVSSGYAGSCGAHVNSSGSPKLGESAPQLLDAAVDYTNGAIYVFNEPCVEAQGRLFDDRSQCDEMPAARSIMGTELDVPIAEFLHLKSRTSD